MAQDPVVGDLDVLMVDADPGDDGATWLRNEIADQLTVSAPVEGRRTLAAGTLKLHIPAVFAGPGKYTLTEPQVELTQGSRSCTTSGELNITELSYRPNLEVETMTASFQGWSCASVDSGFGLEIRIKSAKAYQALTVDPFEANAGNVVSGQTSAPMPVTVKNIGIAPVELEEFQISYGARNWKVTGNDCPAVLSVAGTCTVKATFAPDRVAMSRAKLTISDSTSRGWHSARFTGQGASLPPQHHLTVTPTFSGNAIRWPALEASGGTSVKGYFLHRYVDGIEKTQWVDAVHWYGSATIADVMPAAGIEYAVSVVNEIGEGPTGARTKAGRATEQIAFSGGGTQVRALTSASLDGQVVPISRMSDTSDSESVASSPDGRSLAYVTGPGHSDLWTRRVEPSGVGAPVRLWIGYMQHITHLSWSSDGSQIAFQATDTDAEAPAPCVYVISSKGGTPQQIACDVSSPSWMPDARTLAVIDGRVEGSPTLTQVDAKPAGARLRSFDLSAAEGTPARVSPDGRLIAVGQGTGMTFLETQSGIRLGMGLGDEIKSISWAPDSKQLLALATDGRLYRVAVSLENGLKLEPPVGLWPYSSSTPAYDIAWQRLGLTIEPTPAVVGPKISIAYDSSALQPGSTVSCYVTNASVSRCASPVTAVTESSGTQTLVVAAVEPDGRKVVATRTITVDASGPVAKVVSPAYDTTTAGSAAVQYSASDSAGIASYDVRYRKASYLGGFGAYVQPWSGTTATSVSLGLEPGIEYCVSVRANDKLGNVGAWSAEKCFSRPMDDRVLAAPTAGWTRTSWSAFYQGTATQTTKYGASLTRTVQGSAST